MRGIQNLAKDVKPESLFKFSEATSVHDTRGRKIKSFTWETNLIPGAGILFSSIGPVAPFWSLKKPIRIIKLALSVERIVDLTGDIIPGDGEIALGTASGNIINEKPEGFQAVINATGLRRRFVAGGDSEQLVESPIIPAGTDIDLTVSMYNYGNPAALDQVNAMVSFFYEIL